MPIKIFAAPGDHRTNFETVEEQYNEWIKEKNVTVRDVSSLVNTMPPKANLGDFMLTLVVHYE